MSDPNPLSEIEKWLKQLFENKNFQNPQFTVSKSSEKSEGYVGDIVFVTLTGTSQNGTLKNYNLALKCSKNSPVFREKAPVKDAFLNEIYVYTTIFPTFKKFQQERNVSEPFHRVPTCYGTLVKDCMEVIALENLKSKGYFLWEGKKPLSRKQAEMMVKEYARFHAISLAMKDQEPKMFQNLVDGLDDVLIKFFEPSDLLTSFETCFEKIYDTFKDDLEEDVLEKVYNLKQNIRSFINGVSSSDTLKVISHGDCWNNNFLHYQSDTQPPTFAMLDWQTAKYASPILDLSNLLFPSLSIEDLDDLPNILRFYHKLLSDHLKQMGSDADRLYPYDQFLKAWVEYAKWGVIMTGIVLQVCFTEKEDLPEVAQNAKKGEELSNAFDMPLPNSPGFKKRIKHVILCAVKNNVI